MTAPTVRWAMTCLMLSALTGSVSAGELPRYALKPGQLLTYQEIQSLKGQGEESRYKTTWRLWVTGRNDDGSWRIVAREGMQTLGSSPADRETVTFARFDLYPDGNVPRSPTLGTRVDPYHVFPPLPRDTKEAGAGWQVHDVRDDTTTRCEPVAQKDKKDTGTFDFLADQSTFKQKIYEGSDRRTFHFDRKKGVVTRGKIEGAFGAHIQGKFTECSS